MDILGIGVPEIILIFILALMVFGPRRLPALVNRIGRQLREWRAMSQVFLIEWREELAALEEVRHGLEEAKQALIEARQVVMDETSEVSQAISVEMAGAHKDVAIELAEVEKAVKTEAAQVQETMSGPSQKDVTTEAEKGDVPLEIPSSVTSGIKEAAESDVTTKVASDIAAEVAAKIAKNIATEVAAEVAKRVASEVAAEVAKIVATQAVQGETIASDTTQLRQIFSDIVQAEEIVTSPPA